MRDHSVSAETVVDAYLDALSRGDFNRLRQCLADVGFRFRSPVVELEGADEFVATMWGISAILDRVQKRRRFVDGSEICDILRFRTHFDEPRDTDVVQLSRVQAGRIVAIEVFYDATGQRQLFTLGE